MIVRWSLAELPEVLAEVGAEDGAHAISVLVKDLSEFPAETREAVARCLAQEEAEMPFDLGRGPLLRVKMLRLAEQDHVLLVTMHHIITDGWSTRIMVREFSQLYQAYSKGNESFSLPELPIQYADFSVWQREWLQGTILQKQLQYWKQSLAGIQTLELPTDRQRPPGPWPASTRRAAASSL